MSSARAADPRLSINRHRGNTERAVAARMRFNYRTYRHSIDRLEAPFHRDINLNPARFCNVLGAGSIGARVFPPTWLRFR